MSKNIGKKIGRALLSFSRSMIQPTPFQFNLAPSYRCDVACAYCTQKDAREGRLSLTEFEGITQQALGMNVGYFTFTGGEPLLWGPLLDAVSCLTDNCIGSHVSTNGFRLDRSMAKELGQAGLDVLNLSLDSITGQGYSPKALQNHRPSLTERLRQLRDYGVRIKVNAVLRTEPGDQIKELLEWCRENEFLLSLGYKVPDLTGAAPTRGEPVVFSENLLRIVSQAHRTGILIEPVEYFNNPHFDCYTGKKRSLSIDSEGNMVFCYKRPSLRFKKFEDFAKEDYPLYLHELRHVIKECNPACMSNCSFMADYYLNHKREFVSLYLRTFTKK